MRRLDPRRDDAGYALVIVLLTMTGLMLFAVLALSVAMRATVPSRSTGDVVTATAAAQAGIDEYVARLAENPTYYNINGTGDDPTNKAFVTRRDGSPYDDGRDPRGAQVPGSTNADPYFRYQLLTSPSETSVGGTIRLRVTGTTAGSASRPAESRTLTATLQQPGFLQYIYVTDVESLDPALYNTSTVAATVNGAATRSNGTVQYLADPAVVGDLCSRRWYEGRNDPTYTSSAATPFWERVNSTGAPYRTTTYGRTVKFSCVNIQFANNDVIAGALHTNDALQIGGSVTFQSLQTETSWADGSTPAPSTTRRWWGNGTPLGNLPVYAAPLALPRSNDALRTQASTAGVGCTYTGETRVRFAAGTVKVWSPGTTSTQPGCLDTGNRANEQTLSFVPAVIYVKDGTTACTSKLGYPAAGEDTTGITTDYQCRAGTAFVEGQVKGQTTIATERDIVVTGDLTYVNGDQGSDVLGLIANNFVWVYNPYTATGTPLTSGNITIQAAVLTLQHSFIVQNYDRGTSRRGTLTVDGVIAQKFRGPVGSTSGTTSRGFIKNYIYDERLRYLPPPYFLAPESSPWTATRVTDG